jgi:hypothetical protein
VARDLDRRDLANGVLHLLDLRAESLVDEHISLESVRRALSKIPGSLTADFVRERADR